ncbi:DUF2505 domain-containing protein [Tsukamurella sp. 8F]|uniref:DUF2505 domain-containing protein n=1 Tax=unclassified Tsukamurella TaxID=2633480 RepID=UPI0023BA1003|nr:MULTISPECIES: DUF2505 domain-containing protein [unclassified Tsukamurella]MDF0530503.1 DUF2505 domain-containing protein [Tsukamurella sp. 8J]MDF0586847.1 DUF2505 domain-containing protein [Tsukamurella sp. 8F]
MRRFEATVTSPATAPQVLSAFGDERYWRARFEHFGGGVELAHLGTDEAGTVTVETVQDLRREGLHPLVARVYPRDLQIVGRERWAPDADGATGAISVEVRGAPGSGACKARLASAGPGSTMRVDGEVRVKVPLLGGPVEKVVAAQFAGHIPDIQAFTNEWIAAHV